MRLLIWSSCRERGDQAFFGMEKGNDDAKVVVDGLCIFDFGWEALMSAK